MAVSMEDIKRMMGWCPNAGAMEARKVMKFDDIVVNASEQGEANEYD